MIGSIADVMLVSLDHDFLYSLSINMSLIGNLFMKPNVIESDLASCGIKRHNERLQLFQFENAAS